MATPAAGELWADLDLQYWYGTPGQETHPIRLFEVLSLPDEASVSGRWLEVFHDQSLGTFGPTVVLPIEDFSSSQVAVRRYTYYGPSLASSLVVSGNNASVLRVVSNPGGILR